MPSATLPAGLPPKPHQGVTARILHRRGGAVRGAIARTVRTVRRRSPAAPACSPDLLPAGKPERPAPPRRPRAPRRAIAAPAARRGWNAGWFGLGRRQPAPFTPETCPGLTQEDCAILNTPVAECDPAILRMLLAGLAQHIAGSLPAERGMTDPQAVFAALWSRLGSETQPDAEPAGPPDPPQAASADAPPPASDKQVPVGPDPAESNAGTATEPSPERTVPPPSGVRRNRSPGQDDRPPRRRGRSLPGLRVPRPRVGLPPRRLCYAACAGPP